MYDNWLICFPPDIPPHPRLLDRPPIGDIAVQRPAGVLHVDLVHRQHGVAILRLGAGQVEMLALFRLLLGDSPEGEPLEVERALALSFDLTSSQDCSGIGAVMECRPKLPVGLPAFRRVGCLGEES